MSLPSTAMLRAIERSFPGQKFSVRSIRSRDWACATFVAVRHEIAFTIEGEESGPAADAFLDGIEDREFFLRGHILLEIASVSRTDTPGQVAIMVEALTIENV